MVRLILRALVGLALVGIGVGGRTRYNKPSRISNSRWMLPEAPPRSDACGAATLLSGRAEASTRTGYRRRPFSSTVRAPRVHPAGSAVGSPGDGIRRLNGINPVSTSKAAHWLISRERGAAAIANAHVFRFR